MQFLNSPNLQQTRPHGLILSTCRWAGVQCATTGKHKSLGVSWWESCPQRADSGGEVNENAAFPRALPVHCRPEGSAHPVISIPECPCPEGCVVVWASAARWLPPFYCLALSGCLGAARPHCIGMSRGSKSRIPLNFSDEKGALWDMHSQMGWVRPWLEEGKLPEQQPCSPPSSPGIQGTSALWEGVLCWAVSLEAHIGAAANYLSISHLQGLL